MVRKFNRNIGMSWANSCDVDHLADSGDSDGAYIAGQTVVDTWGERGAGESSGLGYVQLFRLLPPRRRQRLCFARLARRV